MGSPPSGGFPRSSTGSSDPVCLSFGPLVNHDGRGTLHRVPRPLRLCSADRCAGHARDAVVGGAALPRSSIDAPHGAGVPWADRLMIARSFGARIGHLCFNHDQTDRPPCRCCGRRRS
jgi:hypothetical protein